MLANNLEAIHRRIAGACERTRRLPSQVTLIGVTKGVPVETIREALVLGVTDLGENRVQEARRKHSALGSGLARPGSRQRRAGGVRSNDPEPTALSPQPVRWHMIGHLQRNKVKEAVAMFDAIHSVDTPLLAEEIERQAAKQGKNIEVFVQANMSGEASKFGCLPDEVLALARAVGGLPHMHLRGFMTMAPLADDPERSRPHFRRLRALRDEAATALGVAPASFGLSMGMSQDFEVAIEEGADHVRVGTAIFGSRSTMHEG